jgi:peroxiredoxin
MTPKTKLMLGLAIAAGTALLIATTGLAALNKNAEAPNFKAKTVAGKEFAVNDLRGRVVLLDFWATWCPPCRMEAPAIEKLWRAYKDKGLVVIGVAVESGGPKQVAKFAADNSLTYRLVADESGEIAKSYKIGPIPTTYIIDTKGVIRQVHIGFGPGAEKDFEKEIKALLPTPEQLKTLKPL